jgi:hypothetical protein
MAHAKQENLPETLNTLDATKGGIPETGEVKNRDKIVLWNPARGKYPYAFLCMIWDYTLELINGRIRTLTIMRKDSGGKNES